MSMRVATFAMNDRMLQAALRTQAKMSDLQLQEASGQVSTSYGGLGAKAGQVLDLQIALQRSTAYGAAADEAANRVQMMYDALSSMTDILAQMRSRLATELSTDSTSGSDASLASAAEDYLGELASLLNTQFEGRYLFAGSATTTKPVDVAAYAPSDPATADSSYYHGNDDILSVQVSADQTVRYGVTADNPAFEQALRAFATVANMSGSADTETLQSLSDLVVSALDGVTAIQSKLSLSASTLSRASTAQQDFQDFASEALTEANGVDVAAVTVKLSTYSTQLQASYAALAKLQGLSLLSYLK